MIPTTMESNIAAPLEENRNEKTEKMRSRVNPVRCSGTVRTDSIPQIKTVVARKVTISSRVTIVVLFIIFQLFTVTDLYMFSVAIFYSHM